MTEYLRTLFLHPPSFDGFDGGAGSRYQARREIRSFWYPTWLAQPAALVPGSRLVDAPPDGLSLDDVRPLARAYDTFTDDLPRAEAIARRLGPLGITWSVNAKATVPHATLKVLKDHGLRLLLVGYESGSQQILNNVKKGVRLDAARRFTRDAKALGIAIHGTFILGLPGETRETIAETIRFAREIDPDTIQVSLAAPYPGTALYEEAQRNGWLEDDGGLVDGAGVQQSALGYPHLPRTEIFRSLDEFYRRFYFRPRKMISLAAEMLGDRQVMARRLREGRDFLRFLHARR